MKIDRRAFSFGIAGIVVLYLATHIFSLTLLPVFADEAIYIRWSQLIIDDWRQYLLFPLNDGKTPLHMWLMIPFLQLSDDPLMAGRFLSVIVGLIQLFVIKKIVKNLGGKEIAQLLSMFLVTLMPFWVFHHRMALIDGLLTFFLSLVTLGFTELALLKKTEKGSKSQIFWIIFTGVSYGLALLTKLPAIFFLLAFPLFSQLYAEKLNPFTKTAWKMLIMSGFVALIGLGLFASLKLHPAFGQLFSRGQDFTFTTQELIGGEWRSSINNVRRVIFWHGTYFSFTLTILWFLSLFFSKHKKNHWVLFLAMLVFILPFLVFARVFAPRYVLPMVIFSTVSISLFYEELFLELKKIRLGIGLFLFVPALVCLRFFYSMLFDVNSLPFVPIDREQYLEEWSAGQGNYEMVSIIEEKAKQGRVVVGTEGYFGTLPDGLLMYFHNKNVENIEIFGVGQPIVVLPEEWLQKAEQAETAYLLVNTHRMLVLNDPRIKLVYKFPRPGQSSSLDVYEYQHAVPTEETEIPEKQ